MKVTALDVAQRAKVSMGTVSRVLNGNPNVGEELTQRVKQAVEAMKYRPLRKRTKHSVNDGETVRAAGREAGANALLNERRGSAGVDYFRGRNIAVVMLGMDRSLELLPVIACALHGAEAAIADLGANLLLADSPDLQRSPAWLGQDRIEGVILKGALQGRAIAESSSPLVQTLRNLPSVWLLGRPADAWGDVVGPDDFLVGQMAAWHLLEMGHRRVAFVNPKPGHVTFGRRKAGLMYEMQQGGGSVESYEPQDPTSWSIPLEPVRSIEAVEALVARVLSEPEHRRPTAIFCPADSIVVQVYRALAAAGVVVGKDISVMSANNETALASALYPSVTTIDVHARLVGKLAVERLVWRIVNPMGSDSASVDQHVKPSIVAGNSVVNLRGQGGSR